MGRKKHINLKTMEKRINILMLGGPGSGKGTSGEYLSGILNLKHLSTSTASHIFKFKITTHDKTFKFKSLNSN